MSERPARGVAAAGAAREQQAASGADLGRGVLSDLQRQQQVGVDVAACRVEVEFGQWRAVGAGAGDQQDRPGIDHPCPRGRCGVSDRMATVMVNCKRRRLVVLLGFELGVG